MVVLRSSANHFSQKAKKTKSVQFACVSSVRSVASLFLAELSIFIEIPVFLFSPVRFCRTGMIPCSSLTVLSNRNNPRRSLRLCLETGKILGWNSVHLKFGSPTIRINFPINASSHLYDSVEPGWFPAVPWRFYRTETIAFIHFISHCLETENFRMNFISPKIRFFPFPPIVSEFRQFLMFRNNWCRCQRSPSNSLHKACFFAFWNLNDGCRRKDNVLLCCYMEATSS